MEDTLAQALERACAILKRTGVELGAVSAAVLLNADRGTEVAHFWSATGEGSALTVSSQPLIRADGPIDAGSLPAKLLRETIAPGSQAFLVHRWQANRREAAIVFGFADAEPPVLCLPEVATASLELVALAFWSTSEILRLRSELKASEGRLAGRKVVERAKGLLQLERGISEESAYAYLRSQSRRRRVTLARIAEEVVRINGGFDRSHIS